MRDLLAAACVLAMIPVSCGGASASATDEPKDSIRADYCAQYPDAQFFCDGPRFSVERALDLVEKDGSLPDGAILIGVHSSPAGGLAPDGLEAESGSWRLVYFVPGGAVHDYFVLFDEIQAETYSRDWDCTQGDALSIDDLPLRVQLATVRLESELGVVYEPGTFSLNAFKDARCFSRESRRHTLIHSQSRVPTDMRYTVEFDDTQDDGVICEMDSAGCY